MDFDMASWEFWIVMLFDVALLILNDSDLYEDVAMYVKKRAGPAVANWCSSTLGSSW
jgi:hypothetical protein